MYNVLDLFNSKNPPVFIVAEIGINHEGKVDFARRLIEKAKESGADAVKLQVFKTERFYNPLILEDNFKLFKSLELSFDEIYSLKELANSLDMIFFATPLDLDSLNFLIEIDTPIIKIASSDITCEPFLYEVSRRARKFKKIVFLSTGFVKIDEIKRVVPLFENTNLSLLYCVSEYPVSLENLDLNIIKKFKEEFFVPIGFSDHSLDYIFSLGAVVLGARIIEKHFTIDNTLKTLDHPISLNPNYFSKMVKSIREIEKALGSGLKKVTSFEKKILPLSMREMYFSRDLKKGERLLPEDILFLRPGNGVKLKRYFSIVGKKLREDKKKYEKV